MPAIPVSVLCAYAVFALVMVVGLVVLRLRGGRSQATGLDKLILLGPIAYAAPLAAFGTEHFTITPQIAALVPKFVPWPLFWVYLIGSGFILAGLSLVTGIWTRPAAYLVALNFLFFVLLMDAPGWLRAPHNRFALALMLRELSFSMGPLALAAALGRGLKRDRLAATTARYCLGIAILYYGVEQFLHANYVPGIPLNQLTPTTFFGHAVWTYFAAVIYLAAAILLLANKFSRAAAASVGATVLFVELVVYLPFAVVQRTTFTGFNFLADTLMFGGAVLLLARALPATASPRRIETPALTATDS